MGTGDQPHTPWTGDRDQVADLAQGLARREINIESARIQEEMEETLRRKLGDLEQQLNQRVSQELTKASAALEGKVDEGLRFWNRPFIRGFLFACGGFVALMGLDAFLFKALIPKLLREAADFNVTFSDHLEKAAVDEKGPLPKAMIGYLQSRSFHIQRGGQVQLNWKPQVKLKNDDCLRQYTELETPGSSKAASDSPPASEVRRTSEQIRKFRADCLVIKPDESVTEDVTVFRAPTGASVRLWLAVLPSQAAWDQDDRVVGFQSAMRIEYKPQSSMKKPLEVFIGSPRPDMPPVKIDSARIKYKDAVQAKISTGEIAHFFPVCVEIGAIEARSGDLHPLTVKLAGLSEEGQLSSYWDYTIYYFVEVLASPGGPAAVSCP